MQNMLDRKDKRAEARCRICLVLVLVFGAVMIFGGLWGMNKYRSSGFDQESGFSAVHKMTSSMNSLWNEHIAPITKGMPQENLSSLEKNAGNLLAQAWTTVAKEDKADFTRESIASFPEGKRLEEEMKLLCGTYSVSGPKISSANKKLLSALTPAEREEFRKSVLLCIADDTAPVPELCEALCEGLTGQDRMAMMMQIFITSASEKNAPIPVENSNEFKKSIRNGNAQISGYLMAVRGEVNWVTQIVCSMSRTVILAGILLMIDVLMLIFWLWKDHHWRVDFKWILILAIIDFMLTFQVLPMGYLLIKAFFPEGTFTLDVFKRLYTYAINLGAIKNTVIASTATMILGTLLAFPLAWLVGRTNMYGKKFFRSLFVLTYMVPPYVGAMAWLRLLNPNVGIINQVLRAVFHMGDVPGPLNIYSLGGMIWVLTTFYYPYAFITISRAMEKMDPSLEEASRIAGASPLKTVAKITLPMMTPSLIAGALLVFICAASCYGIPSIIGAPGKVHTVTTRIIEYNALGGKGVSDAIGLSVFLMVIAIIILYISDFVMAKRQYVTVSGKSTSPNIVDLGKWRLPITLIVSLFAVIVIVIPFATILITSLKVDVDKSLTEAGNFTLRQWKTIFGRTETIACLRNSLIYSVVAATVGILVSCTMSYLLQRTKIRGRKLPDFLITLGSGTPSVVIALSLIMTMRGNFGINIYNTAYIIIIAYLIKYLMMGMRTVSSAMSQIHVSLEECSQISGASWLRTMFKITGPLIFPSIAAGWFLIFIPCFYELSMTTLLYSNTTKTIGYQLYEYWTFTSQPQACAMAFGILMIIVALNFIMNKITKGEFSI